jgi:DNA primase
MGVSRQNLDQIRNAVNALEIIKEAVPSLKASGHRWRGLCPFHNERTPSFFFMPDKGLWHCFGSCQEGGDVFKFVMRLENLTFPEALRHLAQRAGVRIAWERDGGGPSAESQERDRLLDLLSEAAAFYRDALRKRPDAEPARRHLADRKIGSDAADAFQLGYAPSRNGFLDAALKRGARIEDLLKAGLAARSEKTGRYHDPMWGRLVFPILDPYGRVAGFGGRTLEDGGSPKYINSPETPVYSKGRQLFGLFQGRGVLREKKQAVLVEGYMDVIGCHQAGFGHAVAPLGTALTREQGQLLKRYVEEVVLLFDPDEAGTRASWRSAEVFLKADLFVRVARLPAGRDPDEFLLDQGPGALDDLLKQAPDLVDFWLDTVAKPAGASDPLAHRVRQAEELLGLVAGVSNEILREEWLKKIARRLSLDEAALVRELRNRSGSGAAAPMAPPRPLPPRGRAASPGRPAAPKAPAAASRIRSAEEEVIQILCHAPEVWPESLSRDVFRDARCRLVLEKLEAQRQASGRVDAAAVLADLNAEDGNWFSSLLLEAKDFEDPAGSLLNRLKSLEALRVERERQALEREVMEMVQGRMAKDPAKIDRYRELTRTLKGSPAAEETAPE